MAILQGSSPDSVGASRALLAGGGALTALLARRRSVRSYLPEAPPDEILMELIRAATYAPSSGNEQPWKFIIVRDRSLMKRLSDDAKASLLAEFHSNPENSARKYETMLGNPDFNIFYNAPSAVFIVAEASRRNVEINCTLAACYLMIAAASRGLGTCWIHFARFVSDRGLLAELGLPDGHTIVAPIIVGTPKRVPSMPRRREPEIVRIIPV
jgi:nitroreductase